MEHVVVADLAPEPGSGDAERRGLSDPLRTTDVAINHYRLAPGERGAGLHAHGDQEEVFHVVEGEATIETMDGRISVGAGEAIRFAPGEFHSGLIAAGGGLAVLGLGAPRDSQDVRIPLPCPVCGHEERRPGLADDGGTPVLSCPACGAETAASCPECGSDAMRAALDGDGESVVGVCGACGAEAPA